MSLTWRRLSARLVSLFGRFQQLKSQLCPWRAYPRGLKSDPGLEVWLRCNMVRHGLNAGCNLKYLYTSHFPNTATGGGLSAIPAGRRVRSNSFDHHLTHAGAACSTSGFKQAVCAVIDGYGEATSARYFRYDQGRLEKLKVRQRSPGSLGLFYTFVCLAAGFDPFRGEEWKVMGLAPFGKYDARVYELLGSLVRVDGLRILLGPNRQSRLELLNQLQACRREDLAFTGQLLFEQCMEKILNHLHELYPCENLVLSGGCGLNSSWNGKILECTPFKRLYVNSAPADDGNAIGAALLAFKKDHPQWKPDATFASPYLGSAISPKVLANAKRLGRMPNLSEQGEGIHVKAAELLAAGKIIGWVRGRAEFGPRALGNRSILADPRVPDIKDKLNARVKFREEFRPFAPSILHEHGPEYFEHYQESPYMERSLRFRDDVVDKVPGVVHVNQTGRLQTVKAKWTPDFYKLIEAFYKITGIPLVLNTSFNIMGKPIVHSFEDAIAVFYTTGLDALIVEDCLIEK